MLEATLRVHLGDVESHDDGFVAGGAESPPKARLVQMSWVADQSAKVAQQKVANSDALRGIKVRSTVPNSANVFATRLRCLACCGSPHGAGSDQDLDRRP